MRHVATLFNDPPTEKLKKKIRGRNPEIQNSQSECLADRFYYYSKIKAIRYGTILSILSKEFFLSEFTVSARLLQMETYLVGLKQKPMTTKELEQKWSWLKFN